MTTTLGSFMEDHSIAVGRHKSGGGASEQLRDPDVWPPPTPQEPRYMYTLLLHSQSSNEQDSLLLATKQSW